MSKLKLFTGNSNPALAQEIADHLGVAVGSARVSQFSDGEIMVQIEDNVRGMDVFVMQSTCAPVNSNLVELLIMIDALKRSSAKRITAVMPYYGYARQDRKDEPRVPITAKLVADLIETAGAHRLLTIDLHASQIQGFFNIPVDHLYASPVLMEYFKQLEFENLVVVSPDAGGVERARSFAKRLKAGLAIIDKRREGPNQAKVMNIIGEVEGKDIIILDDMIDTGGTIVQGAEAVKSQGAVQVLAGCSHAILSGPALERINGSPISKVVTTNTVPMDGKEKQCKKIKTLSVGPLLGEAIKRIHGEESLSTLFV